MTSYALLTGENTTLSYDANQRLQSLRGPSGSQVQFQYDANGRLSALIDPAGGHVSYAYDTRGRLATVTYPDGRSRQYRYENSTFAWALTSIIDETGQTYVTFGYDDHGRANTNSFAGGVGAGSIAYSPTTTNSTTTTPDLTSWSRSFAVNAGKVQMTALTPSCGDCGTGSEAFGYDAQGQLSTYTNRQGIATTYTYNSRGLPLTVTEGGIRTRTYTWHPTFNLPTQIAGQLSTTSYAYDAAGRKTSETVSGGGVSRTTTYAYDAQGRLYQVTGPRADVAETTTYTYDAGGNVASVTNALGQVTRYTAYDANGKLLAATYPNGTTAAYSYDARGRMSVSDCRGQVFDVRLHGRRRPRERDRFGRSCHDLCLRFRA